MQKLKSVILSLFLFRNEISGSRLISAHPRIIPVLIAIVSFITLLSGCSYFRVSTSAWPKNEDVNKQAGMNKIFVVHEAQRIYLLNNVTIDNDSIRGIYGANYVFPYHSEKSPEVNSSNRYHKKKGDARILKEVHLYTQTVSSVSLQEQSVKSIAIADIYRFDIYDHDKAATAVSWIFGTLGVIAGGIIGFFLVVFIIALFLMLFGASCPYIYVNTGDGFAFEGEIYSGAIYAPLERDDYLTLPKLVAEDGNYRLKISNELKEIQNTNLTELVVIDHPENTSVLIDKYGKYQTAAKVKEPLSAVNLRGNDILKYVKNRDSVIYTGLSSLQDTCLTDGLILTFDNHESAGFAKIFIRAKNSSWLDYVYQNSHELLGGYYDNWRNKQNNSDPEKLREWTLSQKIPLSVYAYRNGEWIFRDYFNVAGPAAMKEDVIAIDISDLDKGPLRLKFEYGAGFWDIDYVGIDYSINLPVGITNVKVEKAISNKEEDVADLLKYDDLKYYVQPDLYDSADLFFTVPPLTNKKRTVILHSKGYYQIISDSEGIPKIRQLKELQKPGKFLNYSRYLMND